MSKDILPYGDLNPCLMCANNPFLCDRINYCEEYKRYIKAQHYKT